MRAFRGVLGLSIAVGMAFAANATVPAGIGGKVVMPLSLNFVTDPVTTFSGGFSQLNCTLTLTSDDAFPQTDSIEMPATVSGKTATCAMALSYLWHVQSAKSHMTIAYTVSGIGISATGSTTLTRIAAGTLDKIVLPANGATTTYKTVSLTL